MLFLILSVVLFNVALAVALYYKPLPSRPSRLDQIVRQLNLEKTARFHRRQAAFFERYMHN